MRDRHRPTSITTLRRTSAPHGVDPLPADRATRRVERDRRRTGARHRARRGVRRSAGGRTDPGPLRRRQRTRPALDRADRLVLPHGLRLRAGERAAARPGLRRSRHLRHRRAQRRRDRADGEHAPQLPVRRHAPRFARAETISRSGSRVRSPAPSGCPPSSVPRPHTNVHPYNAIRKMAAAYGWDWGPDLAGAGIWKSVGIESWSDVRLGTVRPLALLDGTQRPARDPRRAGVGRRRGARRGERHRRREDRDGTGPTRSDRGRRLESRSRTVERWWPIGLRRRKPATA